MTTDEYFRRQVVPLAYRQLPAAELFARAAAGDAEAFVALVCLKYPVVQRACRRAAGPAAPIEDVALEVFVQLWRQRGRVRDAAAVDGWLTRTARNLGRKFLRDLARGRAASRVWGERANGSADPPDRAAIQAEMIRRVRRAVAEQSEEDQRVLWASEHGGGDAQAAADLGLSVSTYRVRLHRARQRLRTLLKRYGVPPAVGAVGVLAGLRNRAASAVAGRWASAVGRAQVVGLAAVCLAGAAAVIVLGVRAAESAHPPDPAPRAIAQAPAPIPAPPESLQDRNLRIVRDELAARLRDLTQRFYPPDNPVRLTRVRAFGAEVEVEFEATRTLPPTAGQAARMRGRYCTWRRRLVVYGQPSGQDHWYRVNPAKPAVLPLQLPFIGSKEVVFGRAEYCAVERLFDTLPRDPRAEAEHLRYLFGPPGGGLLLPAATAGFSANAGRWVLMDEDRGLFVRDVAGRWRAAGECPGWNPVLAGDRVYCSGHSVIRSRPVADPAAAWEKLCDEPPVGKGEHADALCVSGDRLYQVVHPNILYSRHLTDPKAAWVREEAPIWPNGIAAADDRLFAHNATHLLTRPAGDAAAPWEPLAPWPDECSILAVDGDRLVALGGSGPIYARPLSAGPSVEWRVVGRVQEPLRP